MSIRPSLISRSPKKSNTAMKRTPINSIIGGDMPAMLAERRLARRTRCATAVNRLRSRASPR